MSRSRWSRDALEALPNLRACSFDRGFHSPENRRKLDAMLELNALPKKGGLSAADRAREADPEFAAARRRHPGVESAINGLEHRGLGRVRLRGRDRFELAVGLSVLAANIHRLGRILRDRRAAAAGSAQTRRLSGALPEIPAGRRAASGGACAGTPESRRRR